jgi:hypothetical protein
MSVGIFSLPYIVIVFRKIVKSKLKKGNGNTSLPQKITPPAASRREILLQVFPALRAGELLLGQGAHPINSNMWKKQGDSTSSALLRLYTDRQTGD